MSGKKQQQQQQSGSNSGDKATGGNKDDSAANAAAAAAAAAAAKEAASPKKDVGILEEDDEFEEFPAEDWGPADEVAAAGADDPDGVNVWEDNWDDDLVEDDFSKQLRAELHRQGFGAQVPTIRPDNE